MIVLKMTNLGVKSQKRTIMLTEEHNNANLFRKREEQNVYQTTIFEAMKRIPTALFFLLSVFIFHGHINATEKKFRHFTTSEGLSYNTVFDIAQDSNGFIWAATGEGLNRYDSYGFKVYYSGKTATSLPENEIHSLLVTRKGNLFVGTINGLCLFRPEQDNFQQIQFEEQSLGYIHDIFESSKGQIMAATATGVYYITEEGTVKERLPLENGMFQIQEDAQGNFWSFKRQRLFNFNAKGDILKTYYVRPDRAPESIPSAISCIKIDSRNQLWIGTFRHGPILVDPVLQKLKPFYLKDAPGKAHPMYFVRDIEEDQEGNHWIGTEKGLFIYQQKSGEFEHYLQSFDQTAESINDNAIYKIFRSRENIMWLGTYFGGLNFSEPVSNGFKTIRPGIKPDDLAGKAISQIIAGPGGKLWIATEDAGIAIYDRNQNQFQHILNNQRRGNPSISINVHALTTAPDGKIYSGNFLEGINQIDPSSFKTVNYSHSATDSTTLINNFVFSLYYGPSDILWVGTMDGLDHFDVKNKRFSRFKPAVFRGKFIYDIFQDNQKNFWICTNNKAGLFRYNPENDSISHFNTKNTKELAHDNFICHCVDSRGNIWFGSRGGGLVLFDPKKQQFKTYNMDNGLPNNVVYGILEDENDNLWLSTNKGISKFNPETGEFLNFTVDHGLVGNQFNYKSSFKAEDGTMYFGAVNGLTYFHPDQVKTFESEPEVHLTNFRLFNEPVRPGEKSVLKKDIDLTEEITLKYNQNVISFDFIAVDFHSRGKNNFFYYMEGFETNWQPAGTNQSATYTNLPPGDYTFHIKATNSYNFPNERQRSIKLVVLPPIWKTIWAYLFYVVLIGAIVFALYRFNEIRHREKMTLKIEKIEKEKLNELHRHKINFFTYISHEFKTPLTIILATLDSFFSGENIPEEFKNRLNTLRRNTMRLQFLISQLMDFRKVETDHASPNLQKGDVIQFLREVFQAFNALFSRKELDYLFVTECEHLYTSFDPDKLEKIVSNLLSNAFKYTPRHGEIKLKISTTEENGISFLKLVVSDTGAGISEEKLDKIFNLFYKIDDHQNEYQGSGIGLTLTQSLVKFLNGSISVASKPGEGTTFTVKLPYTAEITVTENNPAIPVSHTIIENLSIQSAEDEDTGEGSRKKEFDILFVEDDKELLKFLCDHFREKYSVSAVPNGREALDSIKKHVPDLIITDLMMPKMDGISLCKELKSNFEYCHIPIIMLTSKSDIETRIESLEVGADQYLSKPFLLPELELQIRNILAAKSNLKKHFIQFGNVQMEHPIKNRDQQFIERISAIVLDNIDNPELNVSVITKEAGIGRTLLHTKLKQILDLSATEFINTIRLKEAQKILFSEPELTMAEVAYKVGFNDPNYFSRIFKKMFNVSPTSYRTHKTEGEQELSGPPDNS